MSLRTAVFIAGYFGETVDFGGGPISTVNADTFLVKVDAAGNYVFA